MTKQENLRLIQNNEGFMELFQNPNFNLLVNYLRRHVSPASYAANSPDALIDQGGQIKGWIKCLDEIENAATRVPQNDTPKTSRPYQSSQLPSQEQP